MATVIIKLLDPVGCVVETWTIECSLKKIDFGRLSYDVSHSFEGEIKPISTLKGIKLLLSPKEINIE